ncbi:PREDICTED: adenylate isopentenyltransferase 3, chloroplastic-like [Camelina sativa]|uniref:Adenylate isopentenyltransferase 3, chloroplastic-like n=1 Tax=Camelina sativa TaxID=90675 RepID=A0ABM0YXU5_CAMSA|nr:PREDICTED: adenylate isopentenyltransferase 3, chloroplastic-like [Camelina sativa]
MHITSKSFCPNMDILKPYARKDKLVVIMGATGTGKSRLSVDLATRFSGEIINTDKMQVYRGLDIVSNKITSETKRGVPHHLLSVLPPGADYFTTADFCDRASFLIEAITDRGKLPIVVGGSNSFLEDLVLDGSRYDCCFLWVDVAVPILRGVVSERVDKMVANGMVEEVRELFNFSDSKNYSEGIKNAVGISEFDRFLKNEPFLDAGERQVLFSEVVEEIKKNTFTLACNEREKIQRLRSVNKWCVQRLDTTPVITTRRWKADADAAWKSLVAGPSTSYVSRFLQGHY